MAFIPLLLQYKRLSIFLLMKAVYKFHVTEMRIWKLSLCSLRQADNTQFRQMKADPKKFRDDSL